jgi:hypothetical protein
VQDPDDFLTQQAIALQDPLDPSQDAVIDVAHRDASATTGSTSPAARTARSSCAIRSASDRR